MAVYETNLPGVGKKFEMDLDTEDEGRISLVIHNTGRREIFHKDSAEADAEKLFELTDEEARQFGTILEGAYFQPVRTQSVETLLDDETLLEWIEIQAGANLDGKTLLDSDLRQETGCSVLAIRRGRETFASPEPEFELQAKDTLVVLGPPEGVDKLIERCASSQTESNAPQGSGTE